MTKFIETHDCTFLNLGRVHHLKPTRIDGERGYAADGVILTSKDIDALVRA